MESDGDAFEHSQSVLVRMTAPWVLPPGKLGAAT
jgi:hypothetical protein